MILKGLGVREAQGCESRGVTGEWDFGRNGCDEKEGVRGGKGDSMKQGSTELPVCQWVLGRTVRMSGGG